MRISTTFLACTVAIGLAGAGWFVQQRTWAAQLDALQQQQRRLQAELATAQRDLAHAKAARTAPFEQSPAGPTPAAVSPRPDIAGPDITALNGAADTRSGGSPAGASASTGRMGDSNGKPLRVRLSQQVDDQLASLAARLDLSAVQQQQVRRLLQSRSERAAELLPQMLTGRMAPHDLQRFANHQAESDRSIRALLTSTQQALFDAQLDDAKRKKAADAHEAAAPAPAKPLDPTFQRQLNQILAAHRAAATSSSGMANGLPPTPSAPADSRP